MGVRHTWGEDRVFFFDEDGVQKSLPRGWTDAGDVDVFVAMAAGRSLLRTADLLALSEIIDGLRRGGSSQISVSEISPAS